MVVVVRRPERRSPSSGACLRLAVMRSLPRLKMLLLQRLPQPRREHLVSQHTSLMQQLLSRQGPLHLHIKVTLRRSRHLSRQMGMPPRSRTRRAEILQL